MPTATKAKYPAFLRIPNTPTRELISILENLGELNVPLPSFLVNIIKTLKNKVEEQAESKQIKVEKDEHKE